MIGEQPAIPGRLKPAERRLGTLKKSIEQADIYFKCKEKKPIKSERTLTVFYDRNKENRNPTENRIWSDNRQGGRMINACPPPCFGHLLDR